MTAAALRRTALIGFVAGVGLLQTQSELPSGAALLLIATLGVLAALLAARTVRGARTDAGTTALVLICVASLLLGFSYAGGRAVVRLASELAPADEGRDLRVTGVIASLPVRLDRGVRFEFEVEQVEDGTPVPRRVLLGWYALGEPVRPGERWSLTVRLRRPHGAVNPGGFDFEAWMLERELRASGHVREGRTVSPPQRLEPMVWRPLLAVERARAWLRDRLLERLGEQRYRGVLLALVIGDQRAIAESDWSLFNRTGIAHLVSISGLHVTMLAALAAGIAAALWRRSARALAWQPVQSVALGVGVLTAIAYALLAGWGVPAQRTVIMLAAVALAWNARRALGPGDALAAAAAVVCLIDPWAVTAAGFWLSFGAVAAIVWTLLGRPPPAPSWRAMLATAARVQLAVTLALIPATVVMFQQVSVVSPLANAVAIPLVSWVVTPIALFGALLAALPAAVEGLATGLLGLANGVFSVLATVLEMLAAQRWSTLAVAAPPLPLAALALAGVAWLLAPPGWPLRALGLVAMLPMFVWPVERPRPGELWVTALDVGQGSAIVLETHAQAWLYDTGPRYSSDTDAGQRVILPYLRWRGLDALDGMIVSHLDSDHSGGAASVLAGLPVARALSSIARDSPALSGVTAHEACRSGQTVVADDLELRVLHPEADDYHRPRSTNAMSCVVEVRAGSIRVLLTGDLPAAEEVALVRRGALAPVLWMAAPHHGSRSSSSEALLAAARPVWAVAQAGYRNRFGHPDPGVVERYRRHGITLERTDHGGALQWRFGADGEVRLLRWREQARRYWHDRPPGTDGRRGNDEPRGDDATDEVPRDPFIGG